MTTTTQRTVDAAHLNAVLEAGGTVRIVTALRDTTYRQRHAGWFTQGGSGDLYVSHGRGRLCLSYNRGRALMVTVLVNAPPAPQARP